MKIIKILTAFPLLLLFFANPVYSQTKTTINLDSIPGTWVGMIAKPTGHNAAIVAQVIWRIHQVDRNSDEMQMSETIIKFNTKDTVIVERPRMRYSARLQDTSLIVQIKDLATTTSSAIKLTMSEIEGTSFLMGKVGEKDEETHYSLWKMNSDTTNVMPKVQMKQNDVTLTPPPPVPPKKK